MRQTIGLLLIALPACAALPSPPTPAYRAAMETPDTCLAARYAHLIGQPKSALSHTALPSSARVIAPGTAVTMDYAPQRLNVIVNAQGIITHLRCG